MSEESYRSKLLRVLNCSFCLDHLFSPRTLLCGHTFCRECLGKLNLVETGQNQTFKCSLPCIIERPEAQMPIAVNNCTLRNIVDSISQVSNICEFKKHLISLFLLC